MLRQGSNLPSSSQPQSPLRKKEAVSLSSFFSLLSSLLIPKHPPAPQLLPTFKLLSSLFSVLCAQTLVFTLHVFKHLLFHIYIIHVLVIHFYHVVAINTSCMLPAVQVGKVLLDTLLLLSWEETELTIPPKKTENCMLL